MLWYLVQTAYQRYERWELKKQLKKLGVHSIPPESLIDIAEAVAGPLITNDRNLNDRESLLLLTHIAYGFTNCSDCEKEKLIADVIDAMGYDGEAAKARTGEILYILIERWQELYPDFLPREQTAT